MVLYSSITDVQEESSEELSVAVPQLPQTVSTPTRLSQVELDCSKVP